MHAPNVANTRVHTHIKTLFSALSRTCKDQIGGFSRTQKRVFKACKLPQQVWAEPRKTGNLVQLETSKVTTEMPN